MENKNAPAFPPQVAQDNLGRIIAPIPGMTKLEYFAVQLLPNFMNSEKNWAKNGKKLNAYQCAVEAANLLLEQLEIANKPENEQPIIKNLND